jgi:hypothetical protein
MASVSIAERKISVTEFLEMDFEEGYIYELNFKIDISEFFQ